MKNKSSSLVFWDVKPKMKFEIPLESHGFLISVLVNDTVKNLMQEPMRYRPVFSKRAATLCEFAIGHA
jgi:hypothetical protein